MGEIIHRNQKLTRQVRDIQHYASDTLGLVTISREVWIVRYLGADSWRTVALYRGARLLFTDLPYPDEGG